MNSSHKVNTGQNTLRDILSALERKESVAVVMASGSDQFLFWDWMETHVRSKTGMSFEAEGRKNQAGSAGRRGMVVTMRTPGEDKSASSRVIELPPLTFNDLLQVLHSRRREQVLHHGIFIPKSTQRYALECCYRQKDEVLIQAFDLIDDASLVLQQSTIALASTEKEIQMVEARMFALAQAIRTAYSYQSAHHSKSPRRLLTAARQFERQVLSLGGRPGAASLSKAEIDRVFIDIYGK